jgi:hypothetical protein
MKKLWLLAIALLFAFPAFAQILPATANLTASDSGACTTAGACLVVTLKPNTASSIVQLTGTFSATLQFEASTSVGGTFVSVSGVPAGGTTPATSVTATGAWQINVAGYAQIRVRCSTYASGTVAVSITSSGGSTARTSLSPISTWTNPGGTNGTSVAISANNAIQVSPIYPPAVTFGHIDVDIQTTDGSGTYSFAILDANGNVICSTTAGHLASGNAQQFACSQGTVTIAGGLYYFAFTGTSTTGKISYATSSSPLALSTAASSSTSASGVITSPVTIPSAGQIASSYGTPWLILN